MLWFRGILFVECMWFNRLNTVIDTYHHNLYDYLQSSIIK